MDRLQCFWVEDTDRDALSLRRYCASDSKKCANPMGHHDASVPVGEAPSGSSIRSSTGRPHEFVGDPRWPTHCSCGYEFQPEDYWQVFRDSIYIRKETGETWAFRRLPAGAMYDAKWLHGEGGKRCGSDGIALHVVVPPGEDWGDHWHVDGGSSNGNGWDRTGTPPLITATPSIQTPRYHGYLRNGFLEKC